MSGFFRKLMWLARWRDKEADLREELEFYLEEKPPNGRRRGFGGVGGSNRPVAV